ncbi:hypothetical protein [Chryseobacterium aquaticum]|uniref:Uncharacterized protein n=1 Tax=Chryseobacterium aquaticum subsp. greenlandense TaxID=345663 RepID=A0A117KA78_9FLAO|nr:hypothetical protein [Chryseobacterium aquaticum]KUJ54016.1 hypothetical protein AR686_17670 [Chryseobacterium aquaticum subsp. greenlandense]
MQTEKTCPICKILKTASDFDKYFSKERQKYRLQNYCKECSKPIKAKRSADYYQNHKKERIAYAKDYANRPQNIEKDRRQKVESKKRIRENLSDSYVRDLMVQKYKFSNEYLLKNPEIVNLYKGTLKIKRLIKKRKNE